MDSPTKTKVFISYAHSDEDTYLNLILRYLASCPNIDLWTDHNIKLGDEWEHAIMSNLEGSAIVLMLISQNFLISDFIQNREYTTALRLHKEGKCTIIPIFAFNCNTNLCPEITRLQGFPSTRKFLVDEPNRVYYYMTLLQQRINELSEPKEQLPVPAPLDPGTELKYLQNATKVYVSLPDPDDEDTVQIRSSFIDYARRKLAAKKLELEIAQPDEDDGTTDETSFAAQVSPYVNDALCSVHLICKAEDMHSGRTKVQYSLAAKRDERTQINTILFWIKGDDIEAKTLPGKPAARTFTTLFEYIERIALQRQQRIKELSKTPEEPENKKGLIVVYDECDLPVVQQAKLSRFMEGRMRYHYHSSDERVTKEQEEKLFAMYDAVIIFYGKAHHGWFKHKQLMIILNSKIKQRAVVLDDPGKEEKRETIGSDFLIIDPPDGFNDFYQSYQC